MPTCNSCGYENTIGARFCSSCGNALTERLPTDDVTASYEPVMEDEESDSFSVDDLPLGTIGMFVVRKGPKKGTRIALDGEEIRIGRDPQSDIFLDDVTVSRDHAKVSLIGSTFEVSDSGSMNGTYVNKESVERVTLVNGDELQIGKFKLVFLSVVPAE